MRHLSVTVTDEFYDTFIDFFKHFPEVSINENRSTEVPLWQQEIVLDRIKNAKPEDYIDASESLKKLKEKYGF